MAARTKSLLLQFWLLFSFKNKNEAPKETFYSSFILQIKDEMGELLVEKLQKHSTRISILILVINLFRFNIVIQFYQLLNF